MAATIAGSAHAQRSAADIESARQAYNEGIALRDKGDLKGAVEKFKAAHALGNTPITGLELCKTHAALSQPVEAREACLSVGRISPIPGETARSQEARSEAVTIAEQMKPKIASLRLRVKGAPEGYPATVTVDGAQVPPAAIGTPRAMNPGTHVVTARVGQGTETRATVDMREGEAKEVELVVQAPPPDQLPPAPPPGGAKEKSNSAVTTTGFIIAGVGGAFGIIGGLAAISAKSELKDRCTNNICGQEDHKTIDRAYTWAGVSTAGFIVAGVGLAVVLYGTLSSPKSSSGQASPPKQAKSFTVTPDVGLGGAGLHGSF
jgi:hypothetical protein